MLLSRRLPSLQSILQVYAVIAFLFSAWTITAFLWKLSAWLLLLNLGEIFTIFSYGMVANLLESLIVLMLVLAAGALLPPELLRDDFTVRGTALSLALIGTLMVFVGLHTQFGNGAVGRVLIALLEILLLLPMLLGFSPRFRSVRAAILWISDRMLVFLFVLLPLFVILTAYIAFRNFA